MKITFYGVRGSCPCPGAGYLRYGGNTACVVLQVGDEPPMMLDLGTGVRAFGLSRPIDEEFRGTALVTHVHWDHVQGLPFFAPLHHRASQLDIYGPIQEQRALADVFGELMRPPFFPIRYPEPGGEITFHDVCQDDFEVGQAKVRVRVARWVLELCDQADMVVHDAQYTPPEFEAKGDWGHSTMAYAVMVARCAGARAVALFHHDPDHDGDTLDREVAAVRAESGVLGRTEVFGAVEGLTLEL